MISESTEGAVEKAIEYGTLLSAESEWNRSTIDQARVFEILNKFAAHGSEGYSTPPLCSSDRYLTTSTQRAKIGPRSDHELQLVLRRIGKGASTGSRGWSRCILRRRLPSATRQGGFLPDADFR